MDKLTTLKNIGKEMERKLKSVGIHSKDDLIKIGSKEVFIRLKTQYPHICLVHLYALQGAIDNIEFNQLSEETKRNLKEFFDEYKKRNNSFFI
ncbi:MAG: TfoX/Sxy family protein [Coprobacillus sp.]|nr:TfoX/Sxy family protein [Coprobacillus sp.]